MNFVRKYHKNMICVYVVTSCKIAYEKSLKITIYRFVNLLFAPWAGFFNFVDKSHKTLSTICLKIKKSVGRICCRPGDGEGRRRGEYVYEPISIPLTWPILTFSPLFVKQHIRH